jgi:hypothetical protein
MPTRGLMPTIFTNAQTIAERIYFKVMILQSIKASAITGHLTANTKWSLYATKLTRSLGLVFVRRSIQRSTCSKSSLKGVSKIEGLASLKGKLAI